MRRLRVLPKPLRSDSRTKGLLLWGSWAELSLPYSGAMGEPKTHPFNEYVKLPHHPEANDLTATFLQGYRTVTAM